MVNYRLISRVIGEYSVFLYVCPGMGITLTIFYSIDWFMCEEVIFCINRYCNSIPMSILTGVPGWGRSSVADQGASRNPQAASVPRSPWRRAEL